MRSKLLQGALLSAISVLAGLVILEIVVRLMFGSPWPEKLPVVRIQPDPDIGWRMVPADFHYTYEHPVQLNALGFRGPEVEPKSSSEYRILALGDSHVYGQGLADSELLTTVAEQLLNADRSECSIRVVNMGVRAYSTNQELALLKKVGISLEPDHVMLFFSLNDVTEPADIPQVYEKYQHLDWYMFDLKGKPEGERLAKWKRVQILRQSALLMWAYDVIKAVVYRNHSENRILQGAHIPEIDKNMSKTLDHLNEFSRLANGYDFRLTIVVIPNAAQIGRDYPAEKYRSIIGKYAWKLNIGFLDLLPAFREDYKGNGRLPLIPYDGHYDAHGNRVMAEAVVKYIQGLRPNLRLRTETPF